MIRIVFNNDLLNSVEVLTFNRSSNFINGRSAGYVSILAEKNTAKILAHIAEEPITSITMYKENDLIYELTNIKAEITDIEEFLQEEQLTINVNLNFNSEIKSTE